MLSPAERQQLATEWNPPPAAELAGFPLHERFAVQAARTPDAVALAVPPGEREGGGELTYGELAGRAGRLAAVLRRRGVGRGVAGRRSASSARSTSWWRSSRVLEAGGAYLPLDPAYPPERLAFMLDDSGARVLVARPELAACLPRARSATGAPADAPASGRRGAMRRRPRRRRPGDGSDSGGDHLAYVIYTSGSTGRPKGVAVTHANVSRLLAATAPLFGFGAGRRLDALPFLRLRLLGLGDLGRPRLRRPAGGGAATRSAARPRRSCALLAAERVTVLNQTPSAFAQLAPAAAAALAGGDGLPRPPRW